ncbi:MAG: D-lyxose/D-mannose family sugar isomerase [Promethearchaeia archaeon]
MKRSEINTIIQKAIEFLHKRQFYLPKFAYWSLDQWQQKGPEIEGIIKNQLGWDITDFNKGNFYEFGLVLFTIRNGNPNDMLRAGKPYCEKIMILEEDQITPIHHHYEKMEDIINRGGGTLMVEVHKKAKNETLSDEPFSVSIDGVSKRCEAGEIIELEPGESITLTTKIYHKFWAKTGHGKLLAGEVSTVNDDTRDNRFLHKIGRFSEIDEDEPPKFLLYHDYPNYLDFK